MVVVVILGILAAMVVPKVLDRPDQARATAAKQDIGGLMQALKLYRLDHGTYPSMNQGLKVLVERPADAKNNNGALPGRLPTTRGHNYHYPNRAKAARLERVLPRRRRPADGDGVNAESDILAV